MDFPPDCVDYIDNSKISLSEKRSKVVFLNNNRKNIFKVEIDNCAISDDRPRCDWLLIKMLNGGNDIGKIKEKNIEIENYIELKGSDIRHAITQLSETIRKVSYNFRSLAKRCFIISQRCPLSSPEIQRFQKQFRKDFSSTLTIKNSNLKSPFETEI